MPKIILEHQLPSNAAPHRRRHSSNTYLGLSPQKRQRVFAAGALALCCLFLLSFARSGPSPPAVGRDGGGSAVDSHRVPVRAQGGRLLGGSRQPSLLEQQRQQQQQQQQAKLDSSDAAAGEYDASGDDDDDTDRELDGDALEAELGMLPASDDDPYAPPPVLVPDNLQPAALKRQLKALTYFLADGGELPAARSAIAPDAELTLGYLAAVGSDFDAPAADIDWAAYIEEEYPLVVFSKSYCPYSKKAKMYLNNVGLAEPAFVVEVDLRPDADTIKYLLGRLTGRSTFPNVILGFEPLGGGDDVELLHAEGGLARKLKDGGVKLAKPRAGQAFNRRVAAY